MQDSDDVDNRRRKLLVALGGTATAALAGCIGGDDDDDDDDDEDPAEPDDSELGLINSTFDELDPIMSTDTASSRVITQIYENLTAFPNGVTELENQLLEDFEVSEDGTTWTFTLQDGIEFHDAAK